ELQVRRNDKITVSEIEDLAPERIVISPGPCTPDEAGISLEVVRQRGGKSPVLGVCLGRQSSGQAFRGQVLRAPYPMDGKIMRVHHDGKTVFKGVEQDFVATRYHSLIVERESLPKELEISATTADGLIMGLRHKEMLIEGVQFHPE